MKLSAGDVNSINHSASSHSASLEETRGISDSLKIKREIFVTRITPEIPKDVSRGSIVVRVRAGKAKAVHS